MNPQTGLHETDTAAPILVDHDFARTAQGAAGSAQFVSFAIGDDQYGADIMAAREIEGWTSITHLPKQPDDVRSVLLLRGITAPTMDPHCRPPERRSGARRIHLTNQGSARRMRTKRN